MIFLKNYKSKMNIYILTILCIFAYIKIYNSNGESLLFTANSSPTQPNVWEDDSPEHESDDVKDENVQEP